MTRLDTLAGWVAVLVLAAGCSDAPSSDVPTSNSVTPSTVYSCPAVDGYQQTALTATTSLADLRRGRPASFLAAFKGLPDATLVVTCSYSGSASSPTSSVETVCGPSGAIPDNTVLLNVYVVAGTEYAREILRAC